MPYDICLSLSLVLTCIFQHSSETSPVTPYLILTTAALWGRVSGTVDMGSERRDVSFTHKALLFCSLPRMSCIKSSLHSDWNGNLISLSIAQLWISLIYPDPTAPALDYLPPGLTLSMWSSTFSKIFLGEPSHILLGPSLCTVLSHCLPSIAAPSASLTSDICHLSAAGLQQLVGKLSLGREPDL